MDPTFASPYRPAACETSQIEAPLSVIVLQSPVGQRTHDRTRSHVQTVERISCIERGIHTWEGDLMLFKQKLGQTNVTTLVERVSRFTVVLKNPNRRTKPVMGKIIKAIKNLPLVARRSITFDRGSEFMNWPNLQAEIGTQTWFCDPSSPFSDIAARYPARQCMAKRYRREHKPTGPQVVTTQTRHQIYDGSGHKRDQ